MLTITQVLEIIILINDFTICDKTWKCFFLIFNQNVSVNDSYILDSIGLVSLKTFVNKKKNNTELTKTCQLKKKSRLIYTNQISS